MGCDDEVDAGCPGHLGKPTDECLDIVGGHHHQVCELVDDDDDVGHGFEVGAFACQGTVAVEVAHTVFGKQFVAAFHLAHGPLEGGDDALDLGHDRCQEVWDAVVADQFDPFGVDHNELEVVWCMTHQQRANEAVDGHRLTAAGAAGDQEVGHTLHPGDNRHARYVLAQWQTEFGFGSDEFVAFDNVA